MENRLVRLPILATLTACAVLVLAGPLRAQVVYYPPGGGGPFSVAGPPPGAMTGLMGDPHAPASYPGHDQAIAPSHRSIEDRSWDPACDPANKQCITFAAETLLLSRSPANDQILVREGALDPGGDPILTTDNLQFDQEIVPRFTLVMHQSNGWDLMFSILECDDWQASQLVARETDISISAPNILLSNVNAARFTYESQLWSMEAGVLWRICPRITMTLGPRFLALDEGMFVEDNFLSFDTLVPSYAINVTNRLIGFQVGFHGTLAYLSEQVSIDGVFKLGYYHNEAHHQIEDLSGTTNIGPIAADDGATTTVGEFRINATFRFNDNVKAWVGYNVLWLLGVATPPNQIPGNDAYDLPFAVARLGPPGALSIDTSDNLIYGGVAGGFDVSY